MTCMKPLWSTLGAAVTVALLYLSAPAAIAGVEPAPLEDARLAVAEGRLEDAARILHRLDPAETDVNDLDFLRGMLAMAARDHAAAAEYFRAILRRDPSLTRVRLELARAYFLAADDRAATDQFERAAADADLPPVTRHRIEAYLAEIRARRRWSFSFSLGLMPDSNVNAATANKTVEIYGLPFHLDPTAQKKAGIGITARIGAGYGLPLGARTRLATEVRLDELDYGGGDHDLRTISGSTGPRFQIGQRTELAAAAIASRRWYGGQGYSHGLGGRLAMVTRLTPRWILGGALDLSRMRYDRLDFLDGTELRAEANVTYVIDPQSALRADIIYLNEDTRLAAFDNERGYLAFRYGRDFAGGWRLDLTAHGGIADYDGALAAFGKARKDRSLGLEAALASRRLDIFGFMPVVAIGHERRDSNIALYDYRRERLSFWLTRNF